MKFLKCNCLQPTMKQIKVDYSKIEDSTINGEQTVKDFLSNIYTTERITEISQLYLLAVSESEEKYSISQFDASSIGILPKKEQKEFRNRRENNRLAWKNIAKLIKDNYNF